jgi:hypothetical protein
MAEEHPIAMAAIQFGLTPAEMNQLSQCRLDASGATGLLLVGREALPLRIPRVPDPVHSDMLLGSRGRRAAEELDHAW